MRTLALIAPLLLLGGSLAQAGPKDFVVYISRLGGDTETARPYIVKFAAHVDKLMGWPAGSTKGGFFADKKEALAALKRMSPGFALLDPPLYFELRAAESLVPIAQMDSKEIASPQMHLVVKDAALTTLAALRGKSLWTTLAESPAYLSRVVFDGKVDALKHFAVKRIGHALKGVRAVLTGKAAATLVDDDQLAAAKKMEGGAALRTIYSSPALPPLPVVVFGKVLKEPERKALTKALLKACDGAEGAAICKEMRLTRMTPAKPEVFKKIQQRFESK